MRPVRSAKSIVYIKIAKLGERLGEFWVVCFFTGLKTNILQQRDIAVLHVLNDFLRHIASGVVTEDDRLMNERMQIFADRAKRIFLRRFPLGPAKMRHQNNFGAMFAKVIDGRQAFPDSGVIGDANLAAGLANVKSPRPVIKEVIEEVGRVVTHDLERFLTTLGTIAAMAPLLGLFGTVVGMIEIFGSQTAAGSNPIQLAHGISVALYNTAFGLIVAIPSMIFYRHFRANVDSLIVDMEQQAIRLVDFAHGERK